MCISAQRYTYLGAGIGLISSKYQLDENPSIRSPTTINGGYYDIYLRQVLTKFLSAEIGYSWRNYDSEYLLPGDSYALPHVGLWAHLIPINLDVGVDVYRNRLSLYASFGYHICIQQYTGSGTSYSFNSNGDSIIVDWDYIADSEHKSVFTIGVGTRFRAIDELIVEFEFGYAFGFEDQREYWFTYWNDTGEIQHLSTTFSGNYWRIKFGTSYPIQRVIELLK